MVLICKTGGQGPCGRPGCTYAIQYIFSSSLSIELCNRLSLFSPVDSHQGNPKHCNSSTMPFSKCDIDMYVWIIYVRGNVYFCGQRRVADLDIKSLVSLRVWSRTDKSDFLPATKLAWRSRTEWGRGRVCAEFEKWRENYLVHSGHLPSLVIQLVTPNWLKSQYWIPFWFVVYHDGVRPHDQILFWFSEQSLLRVNHG